MMVAMIIPAVRVDGIFSGRLNSVRRRCRCHLHDGPDNIAAKTQGLLSLVFLGARGRQCFQPLTLLPTQRF
jgi:hypothetical protein